MKSMQSEQYISHNINVTPTNRKYSVWGCWYLIEMAGSEKNIDFDLWSFLTENVNPYRILTELYKSTDMTEDHFRKLTACASNQILWRYILDYIFPDKLSMSDFSVFYLRLDIRNLLSSSRLDSIMKLQKFNLNLPKYRLNRYFIN